MLFRILKLFGIDVSARIAEVQAQLESRAELATIRLARVLRAMSIFASLLVLATLAGLGAFAVGLMALYSWVATNYGEYCGYAAVGGVLMVVAAVLCVIGFMQADSWSLESPAAPREISAASTTDESGDLPSDHASALGIETVATTAAPVPSRKEAWPGGTQPSPALAGLVALPATGNPLIDGIIDDLRVPASHAVEDVLGLATDTIRRGEREQLIVTLGVAVFAGWLTERMRSQRVGSS